jgi:lactoylglutathione lyase
MATELGPFCIHVTDRDATVAFYEAMGFTCTRRHETPVGPVAELANPDKGGRLQVGERVGDGFELGTALWKLYVNTNDLEELHAATLAAGGDEVMAPMRLEQWPMSISFVKDPDGILVELCQRHPWQDGDATTRAWFGQACIDVSDLDRSVAFWEQLGLTCTSRTSIPDAVEAIVEQPGRGGKLQLAQHHDGRSIDPGDAMWKVVVMVDDATATHDAAVAAGQASIAAPRELEAWSVTMAMVGDPDGYVVELIQRAAG